MTQVMTVLACTPGLARPRQVAHNSAALGAAAPKAGAAACARASVSHIQLPARALPGRAAVHA